MPPDLSRAKNPPSFRFMDKARQMVFERVNTRLKEFNKDYPFTLDDVAAHWFRKIGSNWEVHMTTSLPDSIFYVVSHNAEAKTTSFEIYHKFESQTTSDKDSYTDGYDR